jgi:putative iron-dependent peroxidase
MSTPQPGILAPLPPLARCLTFQLSPDGDPTLALVALAEWTHGDELVVGIGQPLALALNAEIPGLRGMDALSGPGFAIPSTQASLWCWLRGTEVNSCTRVAHSKPRSNPSSKATRFSTRSCTPGGAI